MDRRLLAAIAIVVLVVLVAGTAGGVYAYQQSIPTTATFSPPDGAREVGLDQALRLTFSRPVAPTGVAAHFHLAPALEGKLSGSGTAYTWTPTDPYADLTQYTARLDGFQDGGHAVRAGAWRFTTTIVPRVTGVTTDAGAGVANDAEVPLGTVLTLVFNTPMNASSTQVTANGQPATLDWAADGKSATFKTQGLKVGALQLALAAGADQLGHHAATGWKFGVSLVFKINIQTTPLKFPALVQVPNDPTARDQSGLQAADMVYEYATEGGITRFTAVFTKAPAKVGPVRSGRLISIKLTRHYDGMLYLSGTSEGTFAVLQQSGIRALFDSPGVYYRTSDRYPPNNLYINGDAIARTEAPYNVTGKPVATGQPKLTGATDGGSASVPDHRSAYAYDAATGTYSKTEDGHLMSDAALGQPLRIAMVIVLHTRITTTSIVEDVNGVHGLDFDMDSGGAFDVYYGGQKAGGRWSAPDPKAPFVFTLDGGQALTLPQGLVWVDVVS